MFCLHGCMCTKCMPSYHISGHEELVVLINNELSLQLLGFVCLYILAFCCCCRCCCYVLFWKLFLRLEGGSSVSTFSCGSKQIVSPQCCCCQQTLQLTFLRRGKFPLGRGWKRMLRECELCGLLTPSSWKVRRSVIHSTCEGNCLLRLRFRKAYSLRAYCSNPEWKERRE